MARRTRDDIPPTVLAVVSLVFQAAGGRTQPWYVDRAKLDPGNVPDGIDAAIYYAEVSGWLVGAGEPPGSVAITEEGVRLLEECGLI